MDRKNLKLTDAQKVMIANGSNKIVVITIRNDTQAKFSLSKDTTKMIYGKWIVPPPAELEPLQDMQFYCDGSGAIFKVNSGVISYSYFTSSIRESFYIEWSFGYKGTKVNKPTSTQNLIVKCKRGGDGNLLEIYVTVASLIDLVTPIKKLTESEYSQETGVIGEDTDTILALSNQLGSSYLNDSTNKARPRIRINDLPVIKSNFANKKNADSSNDGNDDDILSRRRPSFVQSYKVGTYTYRGEHCDEVFAKKFSALNIVGIQGIIDPKKHELLADAMKFTHAYIVSLTPEQTHGCGMVIASKYPIVRSVWCDFFSVDGAAGKKPVGGTIGCKVELEGGKFFWVFAYQFDEVILRSAGVELPSALPPELAAMVLINTDANAMERSLGARKLSELNKFIGMILSDDPDATKCGIVVLGDFGVQNFTMDVDPSMSESAALEAAKEIAKEINAADQDAIGLRCEDIIDQYVKPKKFPKKYLGLFLQEITHPRTRSLFLTKLIAKAIKVQVVKSLSRNFTVNISMPQLIAKEKVMFIEYANLVINSWDMKTGEIKEDYRPEFWKAEVKDKLSLSTYLTEDERSYEYDLREKLQPYPVVVALCDAFHVTLKLDARLRIIDGLVMEVSEDDIVDIAVPALRVFPKAPAMRMTSQFLSILTALNARDMCSEAVLSLPDLGFSQDIPYTSFHVLAMNKIPDTSKGKSGGGNGGLKSGSSASTITVYSASPASPGMGSPAPQTMVIRENQNNQKGPALIRSSDIEKFFIVEDNIHFGIAATLSFKV